MCDSCCIVVCCLTFFLFKTRQDKRQLEDRGLPYYTTLLYLFHAETFLHDRRNKWKTGHGWAGLRKRQFCCFGLQADSWMLFLAFLHIFGRQGHGRHGWFVLAQDRTGQGQAPCAPLCRVVTPLLFLLLPWSPLPCAPLLPPFFIVFSLPIIITPYPTPTLPPCLLRDSLHTATTLLVQLPPIPSPLLSPIPLLHSLLLFLPSLSDIGICCLTVSYTFLRHFALCAGCGQFWSLRQMGDVSMPLYSTFLFPHHCPSQPPSVLHSLSLFFFCMVCCEQMHLAGIMCMPFLVAFWLVCFGFGRFSSMPAFADILFWRQPTILPSIFICASGYHAFSVHSVCIVFVPSPPPSLPAWRLEGRTRRLGIPAFFYQILLPHPFPTPFPIPRWGYRYMVPSRTPRFFCTPRLLTLLFVFTRTFRFCAHYVRCSVRFVLCFLFPLLPLPTTVTRRQPARCLGLFWFVYFHAFLRAARRLPRAARRAHCAAFIRFYPLLRA